MKDDSKRWCLVAEKEYEILLKKQIHTKSSIRLRFPNDVQIQANFASMEKIQNIYSLITDALLDKNQEFYLFKCPPPKKLLNLKSTIYDEKLEPCILLYVNFPNIKLEDLSEKNLINDDFIKKYRTDILKC